MNGLHEKRVIVFLGAIETGLMTAGQIKRFVAGTKMSSPPPGPRMLDVIAAAENALTKHYAAIQARKIARLARRRQCTTG